MPDDQPPPMVCVTIRCEDRGRWTAYRGAILLATGRPIVAAAWDVIDRAERA